MVSSKLVPFWVEKLNINMRKTPVLSKGRVKQQCVSLFVTLPDISSFSNRQIVSVT